jgi:hypothetical protein
LADTVVKLHTSSAKASKSSSRHDELRGHPTTRHPYYRFGVRQDNATIWNYRMRYGSCLIYQVSILPNGIVKDAGTAADPACDVPDRRRW